MIVDRPRRLRFAALSLAVLALAGCGERDSAHVQGYVEGEYLRMSAPEAGWVETLAVNRGDRIAAGAPLFTLESSRERAAVAEAQARFSQADALRADLSKGGRPEEVAAAESAVAEARAAQRLAAQQLARQESLFKTGTGAKEQLDQARASAQRAEAQVQMLTARLATVRLPARADAIAAADAAAAAARSALEQAQWRLDQRTVKAPRGALVDDTVRRGGEWAPAGGAVVSLLPPELVKVRFFVPEPLLARLRIGQTVGVACDNCQAGLTANVSFISPQAEFTPPVIYSLGSRDKLVFLVEALPGSAAGLHPGQPVDVTLRRAEQES